MANVEYVQLGTVGLSLILSVGRSGKLTYNDPKKGKRQIRHCLNESSPFVDEQSDFAAVAPIIFKKGVYSVPDRDKITVQFLDLHPGNVANGGKVFTKRDSEKEAEDGLFLEDLIVDLKYQAKKAEKEKAGFIKLQALASVIMGSYNRIKDKSASELRQIVNNEIDNAPMRFYDEEDKKATLFDENTVRNFLAIKALDTGVAVLSPDKRTIKWPEGKTIVDVPAGRKPKDFFSTWLSTDDGMLVAKELEKRV